MRIWFKKSIICAVIYNLGLIVYNSLDQMNFVAFSPGVKRNSIRLLRFELKGTLTCRNNFGLILFLQATHIFKGAIPCLQNMGTAHAKKVIFLSKMHLKMSIAKTTWPCNASCTLHLINSDFYFLHMRSISLHEREFINFFRSFNFLHSAEWVDSCFYNSFQCDLSNCLFKYAFKLSNNNEQEG